MKATRTDTMPMRRLLIPALCLAALTAACDGDSVRISSTHTEDPEAKGALKVVDALQCPQTMGSLTRKGSASAEGAVCSYAGPRGAEVSLHLVKLDGATAADALKAFEDRLSGALPQAIAQLKASAGEDAAAAGEAPGQPTASGERASVRAPGVDIVHFDVKVKAGLGRLRLGHPLKGEPRCRAQARPESRPTCIIAMLIGRVESEQPAP